jgi:hypothetical protein
MAVSTLVPAAQAVTVDMKATGVSGNDRASRALEAQSTFIGTALIISCEEI